LTHQPDEKVVLILVVMDDGLEHVTSGTTVLASLNLAVMDDGL
jgi:hypothetical protein